jgi:acetylornithine deacetylase/succinyl-diaminopimelate desuccinylase-like protein
MPWNEKLVGGGQILDYLGWYRVVMRRVLLLLPLLSVCGLAQTPIETARAYRQAHEVEILRDFVKLLRIPNVATDAENIQRNAEYVAEEFARRGVTTELLTVDGAPPAVYGELLVPGATRTLGIYVHYDGQPADASQWLQGPWEPALYSARHDDGGVPIAFPNDGESVDPEWRLYGRSTGDDKGPLIALQTVLDSFAETGVAPTSNLKFFFDGEEERSSPHLREFLEKYPDKVAGIDLWLFCDGPQHQSRRPQILFGARGVTGLEVTLYGANRPLHSGHYGNWAPVPGAMLASLVASMKDENGRVLIEEFYSTVEPLGDEERAALAKLPDVDDELRAELGLMTTEGSGALLAERLLLPSLTVRGLSSGNTGALSRNIIPPTATATLGIRLVKGNDPDAMVDLVEQHIRQRGFHIVREDPDAETRAQYPKIAMVTRKGGYPAARTSMSLPLAKEIADAVSEAAGQEVLLVPTMGGSLPIYLFTDLLGQPVLILPMANHDNNQHAANENLRLGNLWSGIDAFAAVMGIAAE